jgi:hypothetical protein
MTTTDYANTMTTTALTAALNSLERDDELQRGRVTHAVAIDNALQSAREAEKWAVIVEAVQYVTDWRYWYLEKGTHALNECIFDALINLTNDSALRVGENPRQTRQAKALKMARETLDRYGVPTD